jgi:hypothetical protein
MRAWPGDEGMRKGVRRGDPAGAPGASPGGRRALLAAGLAALSAAACAGDDGASNQPLSPIDFSYLTPLPLNLATIEIAPADPPPVPGDVGRRLAPTPAEAVRVMGRDRLSAVGTEGRAIFTVTRAAVTPAGGGGLTCALACRLEILSPAGAQLGFVTAEARAAVTGAEASRPQAADRVLRRAMDSLNVEFEYQLRRNLRAWLATMPSGAPGGGAGGATPGGVTREELPRS